MFVQGPEDPDPSAGLSSTYWLGRESQEAWARIRPLLLMLSASVTFQPDDAPIRLFRSRVPSVVSQIHPPASLQPTTDPRSLSEPKESTSLVAPEGNGIALLPEAVPIKARSTKFWKPSPATCPESFNAAPAAPLHPAGNGIAAIPAAVPINACSLPAPKRTPATCPELFTARAFAKGHPGGSGIALLPAVVPIKACCWDPPLLET